MPYVVTNYNGTTLTTVADQTIDTTSSPLNLVGKGSSDYGLAFADNFIWLCENFANITPPSNPLIGQFWFDSANNLLKMYTLSSDTNQVGWSVIADVSNATISQSGSAGTFPVQIQLTSNPNTYTTITLMVANSVVIGAISGTTIPYATLPSTVTVSGHSYVLQSRFPSGVDAGLTLATDPSGYVFAGISEIADFADVAERYATAEPLEPGDVVELAGEAEIRKSQKGSTELFGVVSTSPGVRLNGGAGDNDSHPFVAMVGRVPCKITGSVKKGQRLMASDIPGVATVANATALKDWRMIIGRALVDKNDAGIGMIEVVVGK